MAQQRFHGLIEMGHKGPAICYPFDPTAAWGPHARFFVRGTLNGCPFEGEIGYRRRRFYTLLDDELLDAAGLTAGDTTDVMVDLRVPRPDELAEIPRLTAGHLPSPGSRASRRPGPSATSRRKSAPSSKRVPPRKRSPSSAPRSRKSARKP